MASDHCIFGPSVLHRRALCPGSMWAEKDVPDEESLEAQAGTAAHKAVADLLRKEFITDEQMEAVLTAGDAEGASACLNASAPPAMSSISFVMAVWRTLLRKSVRFSIRSFALSVAFRIATIRAACSLATASNSAW